MSAHNLVNDSVYLDSIQAIHSKYGLVAWQNFD